MLPLRKSCKTTRCVVLALELKIKIIENRDQIKYLLIVEMSINNYAVIAIITKPIVFLPVV